MTPVLIPCSRNAHDKNVLVRRSQWDQHGRHSFESETSELGRIIEMCSARPRATGTSREIDCEAIGGWAGEKYLPVGRRVRKSRAVKDQSAPIPEEITNERRRINNA